jgi:hypothetical protein
MGEWHEFADLRHYSGHYRLVLVGTFVLTVVFDLGGHRSRPAAGLRAVHPRMSSLFSVAPCPPNRVNCATGSMARCSSARSTASTACWPRSRPRPRPRVVLDARLIA